MIYLYPANKMENLLALFNKIQQVSPLSLFEQEHIIVQNAGMQHWLNMAIAESRGIAMNIQFSLPAQFLWKLLREIASEADVPEQSLYSREVLVWRIFQLLQSDAVVEDSTFEQACHYWKQGGKPEQQQQKRYQLALKLADLYEQYLIFRPSWVDCWSRGDFTLPIELTDNPELSQTYLWQGKLWQMLHSQQAYNPLSLLELAQKNISNKVEQLPKRISFFGINSLAPMWINFLEQLGNYIDIHFFHLNPCADYWGDIQSEKQLAKQLSEWTGNIEDITHQVGNPLLANWGQQGREFLSLLQQISSFNIDVFDPVEREQIKDVNILGALQQDILALADARTNPQTLTDDSLTVTSCHSAFREIQALHDWLLHQLNDDEQLTPKDILVMCPEIEQYAPYIQAVFARGWQEIDEQVPPLPCSIADRNAHDADPIVANFIDMLSLPDSRFHVTSVIAMLRLQAVQQQFGLTNEDIDTLSFWLEQAAVHWGLNAEHKDHVLESNASTNAFTWQQGFKKLLKGFAYSDTQALVGDEFYLPYVEGNKVELLGQLLLFLDCLNANNLKLSTAKTASQWSQCLSQFVEQLYHPSAQESISVIEQAIGLLSEYNLAADNHELLSLAVVREFLTAHFSVPDTGRQFMVGQVTFCSMLPMRSIPFKVIAVLGLNDGDYPRQRQPLAFDLMSMSSSKLGDRSRRGDDRYLFLEALISARQKLYLSYQGRNVQNNKNREPSIVLQELFDYLSSGYGWNCELTSASNIRQMPLQAFSKQNYLSKYPSFDANWLRFCNLAEDASDIGLANTVEPLQEQQARESAIELNEVIRFYQHPSRYYAQKALSIYFDQEQAHLTDTESFSFDRLASYQLKQQLLEVSLSGDTDKSKTVDKLLKVAKLSGGFADTPITDKHFEKWQQDNDIFSEAILVEGVNELEYLDISLALSINDGQQATPFNVIVNARLPIANEQIVYYRSSTAKAKDLFTLYLSALIADEAYQQGLLSKVYPVMGMYFDTKQQKVSQYKYSGVIDAKASLTTVLSLFIKGKEKPLLLNAELGHKVFNSRKFEQPQLETYWHDANNINSPSSDPYMQFFWPQCPDIKEVLAQVSPIYQAMYQQLEKVKR